MGKVKSLMMEQEEKTEVKWIISGYDSLFGEEYTGDVMYDSFEECLAHCHSNREYPEKVEIVPSLASLVA